MLLLSLQNQLLDISVMVTAIKLSLQEKPKLKPKTATTARLSTSGAAMPEQKLLLLTEESSESSFKDTRNTTELTHQLKQKEETEVQKDSDELKRLEKLELNSEVKRLMTRFDQHQNKQKEIDDQHKKDSSEQFKDLHQKVLAEQNRRQEDQKNLALRVSKIQESIQQTISKSQEKVHQTVSQVQESVQQKVSKSDVRDIVKAEVSDLRKSTKAATQEMMESLLGNLYTIRYTKHALTTQSISVYLLISHTAELCSL